MEVITCIFLAAMTYHYQLLVKEQVKDLLSVGCKLYYYDDVKFDNKVDTKLNTGFATENKSSLITLQFLSV